MPRFGFCIRLICFFTLGCFPLLAQSSTDPIKWSGSVRTRVEAWDWFKADANSTYAFSGSTLKLSVGRNTKNLSWQVDLEAPILLGLPDDAIAPSPQGQLGLGATYYASNDKSRNAAMIFPKQGFVEFKNLGPQGNHSFKVGRFEFAEGTETKPADATLAAVKSSRLAQRLLGSFGFTHVGRSFDGIKYTYAGEANNFTFVGVAPTRGVFQVDGWGTLPIGVFYGAYTHPVSGKKASAEFRLFGMYYQDWRTLAKTDNRPAAERKSDLDNVRMATIGGHYLQSYEASWGKMDFLFWGVIQTGKWGLLDHRAGAASLEAGIQPNVLKSLKPWIRAGVHHGSGDGDSTDDVHGTFFQVLPTPRVYARFPFYNLMNNQEVFLELILRPHSQLTLRSDAHWLRLAEAEDLWYLGGGAFNPWVFGYVGRPSGGTRNLATLLDISANWSINPRVSVGAYFGHAFGGSVTKSIYPEGNEANYGFVELQYRF